MYRNLVGDASNLYLLKLLVGDFGDILFIFGAGDKVFSLKRNK